MRVLLLATLCFSCCKQYDKRKICKIVEEVGGCSRDGLCGTRFTDNSFTSSAFRPIKDMKMCFDGSHYIEAGLYNRRYE